MNGTYNVENFIIVHISDPEVDYRRHTKEILT